MNHPVIPIAAPGPSRQRKREAPKGRRVDPQALAEVRDALGEAPRRRDLLIEHLHVLQDRFGCLSAAHLAALAQELGLAQSEVYEVATFYHHFDVLRDGEDPPPALTVRVCAGLSCELAGARDLLDRLPGILGTGVRVLAAPCIGRCDGAPAALVGQRPVTHASAESVLATVAAGTLSALAAAVISPPSAMFTKWPAMRRSVSMRFALSLPKNLASFELASIVGASPFGLANTGV